MKLYFTVILQRKNNRLNCILLNKKFGTPFVIKTFRYFPSNLVIPIGAMPLVNVRHLSRLYIWISQTKFFKKLV